MFGDLVNPNKLILYGTENLNFDVDYQGEYMVHKEIYIELQDTQWQFDYIDHDRNIARAIVYDENGIFYFVRAERDDDFGKATLIETAGGGVEVGEEKNLRAYRHFTDRKTLYGAPVRYQWGGSASCTAGRQQHFVHL